MKAPVSVCMISRGDPHLEKCLLSFKDYVEEICVVITSDKDPDTEAVCQKLGVKYEVFTDCNKDDKINDFSMARNRSLSLATQPWIMWCDSDDIITGMEKLPNIIAQFNPSNPNLDGVAFLFPYEYSYDDKGTVTCRQYRERLVYGKDNAEFLNPVHEVLVPKPGKRIQMLQDESILFKHQRQYNPKMQDPGRNLRILESYFANGSNDPRNMYYIGLEYANHGQIDNALKYLNDYVLVSGWEDEKAMAYMKLVDIYQALGQYDRGLNAAFELLKLKHNWFESYYALCRMYYYRNDWSKCAYYGKLALSCPPTQTLLFVNQAERFDLHVFLNVALNAIGDVQGAYDSTVSGLVGLPTHNNLLHNKGLYARFLNIKQEQEIIKADDSHNYSIVFVTGVGPESWSPETVKKTGIGGSEMMLINQAKNLAALGHKVIVYAACDGVFDNVEYRHVNKFRDLQCDVLVVSRYALFLGDNFNVTAQLKLLWLHDVVAHQATNELLLKADRILALTQWHKDNIIKAHHVHPDHVMVTRNGIDLTRFHNMKNVDGKWQAAVPRNQYKAINSSSPDRSWPVLLEIWPHIRARVPQAELHLFYGFHNWKVMAAHDPMQMDLIKRIETQIENLKDQGVVFHDRVSQEELSKEFMSAGVWLHPTWFTETSCITAMEARAAGLHIVTSKLAGLIETVGSYQYASLLEGEWTSPEYQSQFIDLAVAALQNPEHHSDGTRFGLVELAQSWDSMCRQLIETKKTNPLVPYQPTPKYLDRNPKPAPLVKLNIACGPNIFPYDGWINYDNADFTEYFNFIRTINNDTGMPAHQQKLWQYCRDGGEIKYLKQNMCTALPHAEDSVDAIYVGQAIEHINPIHQLPGFLAECKRVLKPGGVLRMSTPDLNKLINTYKYGDMMDFAKDQPEFYKDYDPSMQLALIMYGASGPGCTQTAYEGHMCLYTEKSMTDVLTKAGFKEIEFYNWSGQSKLAELKEQVVDAGMSHSFVVECVK